MGTCPLTRRSPSKRPDLETAYNAEALNCNAEGCDNKGKKSTQQTIRLAMAQNYAWVASIRPDFRHGGVSSHSLGRYEDSDEDGRRGEEGDGGSWQKAKKVMTEDVTHGRNLGNPCLENTIIALPPRDRFPVVSNKNGPCRFQTPVWACAVSRKVRVLSERVTSVCSCRLVNVRACTEGDRVDPTLEMVRVRVNCKGVTPPTLHTKIAKALETITN